MVEKISKYILVTCFFAGLLILSLLTVWPIVLSAFGGLILAYMLYPVYKIILRFVREENISALLVVLLVVFIIFLPLWFLFPAMARQGLEAYAYLQKANIFGALTSVLSNESSLDISAILNSFLTNSLNSIFSKFTDVLLNLPGILLQAAVVLFVFFFGLRDGEKLKLFVKQLSPFNPSLEESLEKQFKDITSSVIYGHIITGVLQGILTGIGLFIFGVPNALLLTAIAVFVSVLPIIGAWLVWAPAGIYLLISGHSGAGIGLLVYGGVLISWIDNILRPYIVARKANLSSGIVLIGMIGGLITFGVLGLVLGPLILAYLIVIMEAYRDKRLSDFFTK